MLSLVLHFALAFAAVPLASAVVYSPSTAGGVTRNIRTDNSGGTARIIMMHNYCPYDVSYLITPAACGSCKNGQACPAGSWCDSNNGLCFFNVPRPDSNSYTLPAGADDTIRFPVINNGLSNSWNGNIGFCTGKQCATNQGKTCSQDGCSSALYHWPVTMIEFNFLHDDVDWYDGTLIHGLSVPVEVTPEFEDPAVPSAWPTFTCGAAGGVTPTTPNLGPCSWEFDPPDSRYVWVTNGGTTPCTTDSQCSNGQVCGISGDLTYACGDFLGYWTANNMCALICTGGGLACTSTKAGKDYFDCGKQLQFGSVYELYACDVSPQYHESCYKNSASYCCGCEDWADIGIGIPASTERCKGKNPDWKNYAQPGLEFLKKGVPNVYTFPYDDITSLFTCMARDSSGKNGVVYHMNTCPQLAKKHVSSSTPVVVPSSSSSSSAAPVPSSSSSSEAPVVPSSSSTPEEKSSSVPPKHSSSNVVVPSAASAASSAALALAVGAAAVAF